MSKPLARFIIEIPDTPVNSEAFNDSFDDMIAACDDLASTIADEFGFERLVVRES